MIGQPWAWLRSTMRVMPGRNLSSHSAPYSPAGWSLRQVMAERMESPTPPLARAS